MGTLSELYTTSVSPLTYEQTETTARFQTRRAVSPVQNQRHVLEDIHVVLVTNPNLCEREGRFSAKDRDSNRPDPISTKCCNCIPLLTSREMPNTYRLYRVSSRLVILLDKRQAKKLVYRNKTYKRVKT
jgi:hypothetical protein